jgi:hypothetical protein
MKVANASKLDRKSGVRWGERGAPVGFPLTLPEFGSDVPGRLFLGGVILGGEGWGLGQA